MPPDAIPFENLSVLSLQDHGGTGHAVWFRVQEERCKAAKIIVYVPRIALFKNAKTRSSNLEGVTAYGAHNNRYSQADDVLEHLSKKTGQSEYEVLRVKALLESVEGLRDCLCKLWRSKVSRPVIPESFKGRRDMVLSELLDFHKILSPEKFEAYFSDLMVKLGVKTLAQQSQEAKARADEILEFLDFKVAVGLVQRVAGIKGEEAEKLAEAKVLGKRNSEVFFSLVPKKPTRAPTLALRLPDGTPWDKHLVNTSSTDTHDSTLNRILYIDSKLSPDVVCEFRGSVDEQQADLFGAVNRFKLSEVEQVGDKKFQFVDALEFFRTGFFATAVHATRVPTKKTRQAIISGQGSLYTALRSYATKKDPGLKDELDKLNLAWQHLFQALGQTFYTKQVSHYETSKLPSAYEVIKSMYLLDKSQKTPELLLTRAFLGVTMCLGLRSGDVGLIRTTSFKSQDTSGDSLLLRPDGDTMTFVRTKSKTMVNGLQRIPVPAWLCEWIYEYEQHGRPSLMKGDEHGFLFVTPKGQRLREGTLNRVKTIVSVLRSQFPGAMLDLQCFTQLRGIFFNSREDKDFSILDLLGRADRWTRESMTPVVVHPELPPRQDDDRLRDCEETKKQFAYLNNSSVSQMDSHYSEKVGGRIMELLERLDKVKQYVFHHLDKTL